ncbi:hypothetical protein CR513_57947, partial [Mucuna pruriens]
MYVYMTIDNLEKIGVMMTKSTFEYIFMFVEGVMFKKIFYAKNDKTTSGSKHMELKIPNYQKIL